MRLLLTTGGRDHIYNSSEILFGICVVVTSVILSLYYGDETYITFDVLLVYYQDVYSSKVDLLVWHDKVDEQEFSVKICRRRNTLSRCHDMT